jgi:hypothetical protein
VVSVTDLYGLILGFLDRSEAIKAKQKRQKIFANAIT